MSIEQFRTMSTTVHTVYKNQLFVTRAMILVASSTDTPEWSIDAVHGSPPTETEHLVVPETSIFEDYVKAKAKDVKETRSVSESHPVGPKPVKSTELQQSLFMHM